MNVQGDKRAVILNKVKDLTTGHGSLNVPGVINESLRGPVLRSG